jgi:squalene synthase HpnC
MLTRELHTTPKRWSSADAFRVCEELAYRHYENFPVASWLIPKAQRKYVAALYSFARTADDFADEPGYSVAERIENLRRWEERLANCYEGTASHPIFVALAETVERFQIPQQLFLDLLSAFRQDVTINRYETFDELLAYCQRSANPVGRLILLLFNYRSEQLFEQSDAICAALQLTNFLQDVSVDMKTNRIYIPQEDFAEYEYTELDLQNRTVNQAFRMLMESQVRRTEELFAQGRPLLDAVGTDLRRELRLTWHGGMEILKKIRNAQFDVLSARPKLSAFDKLRLLVVSL